MSTRACLAPAIALSAACANDDPPPPAPLFKPGGVPATPPTATSTQLAFTLPPGTAATLTASVQYIGTTTATRSNAGGCASVTPASRPAAARGSPFASTRNGNTDLYRINPDRTHEARLTANPAIDIMPRFGQ